VTTADSHFPNKVTIYPLLASQVYFPLDPSNLKNSLKLQDIILDTSVAETIDTPVAVPIDSPVLAPIDTPEQAPIDTPVPAPTLELLKLEDISAAGGHVEMERVLDSQIAILEMVKEIMEREVKSPNIQAERLENGAITKDILAEEVKKAEGRLCILRKDFVKPVSSLSQSPLIECKEKPLERCHTTYNTVFKAAQEEVCEEVFNKQCMIAFKPEAVTQRLSKCSTPSSRSCNGEGPEVCTTRWQTVCSSFLTKRGHRSGEESCSRQPQRLCGRGCQEVEGLKLECTQEDVDTLIQVPEEQCSIVPQKVCKAVTKLVPGLQPTRECTNMPQQVCSLNFDAYRNTGIPLETELCFEEEERVQ